ncbi:LysR substrate-binding domain-containing protein [Streptomyces ardesiacus]|uniref:LysR substrate-binding domain-containing protein n=1 Tax=Streptomyces ardesiacus TaxID=285564 RepID=UPI00201F505E|nr:LysR family transcriptional regulator [Streptomyces ardesiacus]MCL7369653.1 LysR substrate-binding domain-containing protein [Streptomyces ardesiacus]
MELELRHLRVLCAIADAGGVGRAAAALGYTQPAMSTQLRRIEGLLGEGVFLRSSAGVELTAYGAQVVGRAREILALSDNLARLRPPRSSGATRRLRLGAINTPVVPTLLDVLREACPDLTVSVSSVYATGELIDLLEAGELDVALGCDYPGLPLRHSPKLDHRAIRTVPVFVATPADHPLAHRLEVSLADLSEDAWFVSADDGVGWPGAFYNACGAAGFRPAVTHEFHMLDQLQSMIAKGLGVAAVQPTVRPVGGVLVKPLAGDPLWQRHLLVWRRDSVEASAVEVVHHHAVRAHWQLLSQAPHFQKWVTRAYAPARPTNGAGKALPGTV